MKLLILLTTMLWGLNSYGACYPAREVIELPENITYVGNYARVHPSGNFVLTSAAGGGGSSVVIYDLRQTPPRVVQTPMNDETYPVEPSWTYLASPNHGNSMKYFRFQDILDNAENPSSTQPAHTDSEHNQFYHSAAELPGSTPPDRVKVRTMLWQNERYRDITLTRNSNGTTSAEAGSQKRACQNIQGDGYFDGPILSKNGQEMAVVHNNRTKIFKINSDSSCTLVDDLGFQTGKVSFNHNGRMITFQGTREVMVNGTPQSRTGVFIYNRQTKRTAFISNPDPDEEERASYPGYAKDGRIVYVDRENNTIVRVDPNQVFADGTVNPNPSKCIQKPGSGNNSGGSSGGGSNQ